MRMNPAEKARLARESAEAAGANVVEGMQ